jgi:hypothetical protein
MMFVENEYGQFINLAHALRITPVKHLKDELKFGFKKGSLRGYNVALIDGSAYDVPAWSLDPDLLHHATIPASTGQEAVIISELSDPDECPSKDTIFVQRLSVVAWRVHTATRAGAEPVFVEEPASNSHVFIKCPDGKLCSPENGTFDSEDEAIEDILKYAKRAWAEKKQAATNQAQPQTSPDLTS